MTRHQAFRHERLLAALWRERGDPAAELRHLERAHILSQPSFIDHSLSHVWLFAWAWRQRDFREMAAQLLRLPGSLGSLAGSIPWAIPGHGGWGRWCRSRYPRICGRSWRAVEPLGARQFAGRSFPWKQAR
ncbi:DUF3703 domain-containing protein [Pseudomonas indica]|uniref:DUF3703 domain-containing protein n=1 Tax=Pseudomonas indica TaxID=137658 RepID=A0A1G9DN85_9PSED|nr:DUF3703 domain-containing protein [Pseudomonas indica]SDK65314.1 Protein of unknown function [Pseudomonas indica]